MVDIGSSAGLVAALWWGWRRGKAKARPGTLQRQPDSSRRGPWAVPQRGDFTNARRGARFVGRVSHHRRFRGF
jgi:hypothetical protein